MSAFCYVCDSEVWWQISVCNGCKQHVCVECIVKTDDEDDYICEDCFNLREDNRLYAKYEQEMGAQG